MFCSTDTNLAPGGGGHAGEGGEQGAGHLRADVGPVGRRVLGQAGQGLGAHLHCGELVEQLGIAHHAAHRHGAVVGHLVDGGGGGLGLDGRAGDVATHRVAGDIDAGGRGQRAAGCGGDGVEVVRQLVGVFDAGAHVVVVAAVAGRGPGIALLDQVAADRRRADGQRRDVVAAEAVGVHHQLAVPVGRHLDLVDRAIQRAGIAAGGGHVDGVARGCRHGGEGGGHGSSASGEGAAVLRACGLGHGGRRGAGFVAVDAAAAAGGQHQRQHGHGDRAQRNGLVHGCLLRLGGQRSGLRAAPRGGFPWKRSPG
jgi:hypothetical protein